MSADIRQWQEAEGRTDEEMAELLSDRLGRVISTKGYRMGKARQNPPSEWLHALNIAPVEPSGGPQPVTDDDGGGDDGLSRAKTLSPLPFDPAPVRVQIILAYTFAGKGIALAISRRSPSPSHALYVRNQVGAMWEQAAPDIADAYIQWAKEDANVARILQTITLGGPKGVLVTLHVSLFVSTLVLSGAVNPNQFVPPTMRQPQETDHLADDGSPVVDFTEGVNDGNPGERDDIPPQPSTTTKRRTRAKAAPA